MERRDGRGTVGELKSPAPSTPGVFARAATGAVWAFFVASLTASVVQVAPGPIAALGEGVSIDGFTLLMWTVVGFFGGIVHSYSLRYMTGDRGVDRFFGLLFAFVVSVAVLVAADHIAVFAVAWGAMGLVMARLIGHDRTWPQARRAGRYAGVYFAASTGLLVVGLAVAWYASGAATISGIGERVGSLSGATIGVVSFAVVAAAMVQSALIPFHSWLLGSMTAPTPASALMHAGFVNAGGILAVRLAPFLSSTSVAMAALLLAGAISALGGKLLKSVQVDVKGKLGCSTVGQMGFMLMQAGLGYFGAAIAHLILHGFYKAYMFLSAGGRVEANAPEGEPEGRGGGSIVYGAIVAVAGAVLFAALTGKGTELNSGLVLTAVVALTTFRAVRAVLRFGSLPARVRYGGFAAVFLSTIAVYAGAYHLVSAALAGVPAAFVPAAWSPLHLAVTSAFFAAYAVIETGLYKRSGRLYGLLRAATRPPAKTLLNAKETRHGARE